MDPSIVLADPSAADRCDFVRALHQTPYHVVALATHPDSLLQAVARHRPWCAAVSLDLPAPGARAAFARILQLYPATRFLALHTVAHASDLPRTVPDFNSARTPKPLQRTALLAALASLDTDGADPRTASSRLFLRVRRAYVVRYKGVEEGFFARRREAVTTEFSAISVVLHAPERLRPNSRIAADIEVPGEPPLKAVLHVSRVEPVPGLPRFEVTLTYADMVPAERERLKHIVQRQLERKSEPVH